MYINDYGPVHIKTNIRVNLIVGQAERLQPDNFTTLSPYSEKVNLKIFLFRLFLFIRSHALVLADPS